MIRKIAFLMILLFLISGCSKSVKTGTFVDGSKEKPSQPYEQYSVYGTLADIQKNDGFTTVKVDYETFNCEKNTSTLSAAGELSSTKEPVVGNKYHFNFMRFRKGDNLSIDLREDGLEICKDYHDSDIVVDTKQQYNVVKVSGGQGSSLRQTNLNLNQPTQVTVELVNRQDIDLKAKILDIAVIDETIAKPYEPNWVTPSYEERLKNATMEECKVEYESEQLVQAKSRKTFTFTATCTEPIDCEKFHGDECHFYIIGNISFVDELGFEQNKIHTIKQEVRIKQSTPRTFP